MQQVYLLLRNNQQTGPYSLEDILQLNLQPFDLVWVEGRSAAWQYPGEIASLKPYVPGTPQPDTPFMPISTSAMEQKYAQPEKKLVSGTEQQAGKKVFVSMPRQAGSRKSLEEPADEIPRQQYNAPPLPAAVYNNQYREEEKSEDASFNHAVIQEENYPRYSYPQRNKKKTLFEKKNLVVAAVILGIIAGGYYIMSRPSVLGADSVVQSSKQVAIPPAEEAIPHKDDPAVATMEKDDAQVTPIKTPDEEVKKKVVTVLRSKKSRAVTPPPQVTEQPAVAETAQRLPQANQTNDKTPDAHPTVAVTAPEKKKKLGNVIKNIFGKKEEKKEEPRNNPTVLEEPRSATNRQSTRREETATKPAEGTATTPVEETERPALATQIDITSNAPENWMMGVTGLKVTLHNRSNVTIQSAAVEVLYYDDNNRLLEKKLVFFSNVRPKGKTTLAAPDHKWADHVDFRLGAVSAKDDRYAQNK